MATSDTKTETTSAPKSDPNPFAAFASLPPFDPMAMWAQGQQAFAKLMTDATSRWQTFAEQCASIEHQVASHANTAVTNWAQLAKDAIAYGTQLAAEGRKLSIETATKMGVSA